jgi:hypothetical protein
MKVVAFIVSACWIVMPLWAQPQVVTDPPEARSIYQAPERVIGHRELGRLAMVARMKE